MIRRLALAAALALWPAVASAQFAVIAPTQPTSDNGDRIATTAWVNNLVNAGLPLASGKIWIGSVGGIATAQTPSGDLSVSNAGVFTFGTVNANVGSFGSVTQCSAFTVNGKGLITAASQAACTPAVGSITGLGTGVATALGINVGSAGAFVTFNGALGTPLSGVGTNLTGAAAGLTAGNVTTNASLTGDVTSVGNATTIGSNKVTRAMEAQGVARSVIGVTGNATANVADIQGTANQFLGVNSAGTALAFNTLSQDCTLATGVITCLKTNTVAFTASATAATGQLPGTATNDNASAGNVGEFQSSEVLIGSEVTLTTATAANVTSIVNLAAGDWDVTGNVSLDLGGTTAMSSFYCWTSTTSATLPTKPNKGGIAELTLTFPAGQPQTLQCGTQRISLASPTTVYLSTFSAFTTSTNKAYGFLRARRVR